MTGMNNTRLYIGNLLDVASASRNPILELDPSVAYVVTMANLIPLIKKDYKLVLSKVSQKVQHPNDASLPVTLLRNPEKGNAEEPVTYGRKYNKGLEKKEALEHFNSLNTEQAYMYLITTVLPMLQNQAARSLDEQGKTMEKVARLFDKWNEIQEEITKTADILKKLREEKRLEDVYIDVTKIELFRRPEDRTEWLVATIKDPYHVVKIKINDKVAEFKELLTRVKKSLPSSSKQLVDVLNKSADQLILKDNHDKGWFNFNWNNHGEFKFEIQTKDVPELSHIDFSKMKSYETIAEFDTMKKVIWDRLTGSSRFFIDSDQSKFKAYMDNITKGITALTSVSNMTQQQLQIDTQYYNSLLGLQKSAQESLNKTIQAILNNMRP